MVQRRLHDDLGRRDVDELDVAETAASHGNTVAQVPELGEEGVEVVSSSRVQEPPHEYPVPRPMLSVTLYFSTCLPSFLANFDGVVLGCIDADFPGQM